MTFGSEMGVWIPPGRDIVGTGSVPNHSGINDWHIRINRDRLGGAKPAAWRVRGGLWYSMVDTGQWRFPYDKGFGCWDSLLKVDRSGSHADLYFEPLLAWPGDIFEVEAILGDSSMLTWRVLSNGEGWRPGGVWMGQGGNDNLGWRKVESDGIRDWEIVIEHPFCAGSPSRVDVWLPYDPMGGRLTRRKCFDHWSTASGRGGMPVLCEPNSKGLTVLFNPVLACGGDEFFVRVVRPDKSWAMWKVIGMGSDWETGGKWYGQDDVDLVGEYDADSPDGVKDWHLAVQSPKLSGPVRWMVRGAKTVWEAVAGGEKLSDPAHRALLPVVSGSKADLYFAPAMERAGDTFYVSAVLADGSLLNWGVTSIRQLRSKEVEWHGQVPEVTSLRAAGGTTNSLNQWCISVKHDKLSTTQPYLWTIKRSGRKWQFPRETDEDIKRTLPMTVEVKQGTARLYLEPEWVKPGATFDIEGLFPDGTLVQWTALADGSEWAGAAQWLDSGGADFVGHSLKEGPDDKPDWVVKIDDERLREGIAQLEVQGAGWRWQWPDVKGVSPVHLAQEGESATLNIAPAPGKRNTSPVLTIEAILCNGNVLYWKAVRSAAE